MFMHVWQTIVVRSWKENTVKSYIFPQALDYLQRLAGKRGTAFTGEELKNMVATALEQQHLERLRL